MSDLPLGLYDLLLDAALAEKVREVKAEGQLYPALEDVSAEELPERVGELVGGWVEDTLANTKDSERPQVALALAQAVLGAVSQGTVVAPLLPGASGPDLRFERLLAVELMGPTREPRTISRPRTPLRDTVLMTNIRDQVTVGGEIIAEIDSADRIDVVMAFIRFSGVRRLLDPLRRHVDQGRPLRIVTTTYTGTTEQRALEELANLGAEVKVSYDTSGTRLHAKAWFFGRRSGFSTIYVGSSNLTHSAQVSGKEWNVRASQWRNPELVEAFERTFAVYWEDPHFKLFDPDEFAELTTSADPEADGLVSVYGYYKPYPYQMHALEQLELARHQGRPHNLVAAATGTGKTVIAAFDYLRLKENLPRARLLFVAHRKEILEQSIQLYRDVLCDGAFGELWVDGQRPSRYEHVFASVQSLARGDIQALEPTHFDLIVVDEFHHAAAATYRDVLDHFTPRHLLGLTATPERTDGLNVLGWFDDRIAVELRLWDALEQELLCPFDYFGIHDATDLSAIPWRRGRGYDASALANVYTADHIWASKVIQSVRGHVGEPHKMRALGYCVSIGHAEFMAEQFQQAGIKAMAVTSASGGDQRDTAIGALRSGEVQVLFTVDLFNEGVDIPEVDVLLMLRPTDSATVFLQQLGRGLRHSEGKDVLTVLDFVGQHAKEFRLEVRFRQMLGNCTRKELIESIEEGFPRLPAGCSIQLDPVARDLVLQNVKQAVQVGERHQVRELVGLGDISLADYMEQTGLELQDVFARQNSYWTQYRRMAGHLPSEAPAGEERFGKGVGRLLHVDDLDRIDLYDEYLRQSLPTPERELEPRQRLQIHGLLDTLMDPQREEFDSLDHAAAELWRFEDLRDELVQVLGVRRKQMVHLVAPLESPPFTPLQSHATYSRKEVTAALGQSSVDGVKTTQGGVSWLEGSKTMLMFVTLNKADKYFSESTSFHDYAISDELFHWESQNSTTLKSPKGQRLVKHRELGVNLVLFVRETRADYAGRAAPFFCAGNVDLLDHKGEKPIQITWRLRRALPGDVFIRWRAAVA